MPRVKESFHLLHSIVGKLLFLSHNNFLYFPSSVHNSSYLGWYVKRIKYFITFLLLLLSFYASYRLCICLHRNDPLEIIFAFQVEISVRKDYPKL